ncbi:structural maintenance of chromosomes protein 5-like isoform X1 [Sinocyclocheilus grahami]|uniref:structural maintenance of chromosomes protein 5-like isoform X1 n=1 Tax=Sinocyclocheilus grahami TaxID=75366 RepID=UPI0007AD03FD|nr:PREDICTED: structural maintenance of chromosomes protein 5-like isoform X1 [Sinocyclocheilus grahami]XP_016084944.1 PREDICTED: structural maintenance of chromosomes protein 5-like isoform X1 [Sinocyclocheilus grahami]
MDLPQKRNRISHEFTSCQPSTREAAPSSSTKGQAGGFVEGAILRISMHNFLTYDHSEVFPGPKLNMIVGANGTGKSSIVCAICLGLAGKTAVLGRGDKVGLYVKRGCSKGSVEIELYRASGNLIITREIQKENNQSTWMLNKKHASQRAVEEAVKELHIQVGNLCQFLPQEKVGEFAKMSNIELLEATEKSVGPPEMYEFHCELKTYCSKESKLENVCKEKANFLEKARQSNERNKLDMDRYYTKTKHLDRIQMLEKKKPLVEYETARKELEGVKKEREEMKRKLKSLKEAQEPLLRKIRSVESQLQPIEHQMKELTADIKGASQKCKQKHDQLELRNKEVDDIRQDLSLKQTEEADRQKRIGHTQLMIKDLQKELQHMGSMGDVTPQIEDVNAELKNIQDEKAKLEGESLDLRRDKDEASGELHRLQNRLRSLEDMMKMKEDKLRVRFRDTYTALKWLRDNRDRFKGNVYDPMMLVINVRDARHAKYVESQIPANDLRAFVFQRQEDMEKFMTEVRDTQRLRVNSVIAPAESCSKRPPSRPLETLKRYGFFSYLRELFDAPEEVMSYLCHQYRVNDVPVGTEKTKSMIEMVIRELQLRVIYTAEEKYNVKKSNYSNNVVSSNSALRPSQFLTTTIDADERHQLEEQLRVRHTVYTALGLKCWGTLAAERKVQRCDQRMAAVREQLTKLDRHDNELRAKKKKLSELKGKKRQLEQKISTKQDRYLPPKTSCVQLCFKSAIYYIFFSLCSLRQMEQNEINLQAIEEETNTKIAAVNNKKVAIMEEYLSHMQMKARMSMEKVYLALQSAGVSAEKTKLVTDCRDSLAELKQAEGVYTKLDQIKTNLLAKCKTLMSRASAICKMSPGETAVPDELHRAFSQFPDTLDEIDAMLNEEKTRAECFTGLSDTVVEEYNRRELEIKNMEKELDDKTNALRTYRQNIAEAKERWLNPLKQLVDQINKRFGDFFRSMQCVGEVDLHWENKEEYDKYGIRIRVKFHSSAPLHELTPHHQSGGERSVSTMLYLMALQELNRCPFRVVDEINQGMDPVNERRVFNIVARTACGVNTSQYFFITPKLLQNLQYAEQMTILCVHNGPYMLPPNKWSEKAFIRRAKRGHNR